MTEKQSQISAYVKHRLPGRIRLKIPQKKGDAGYFERMAESFADCPGLTQLHLNPHAASLLICHEPETDFLNIAEFAEARGLFTVAAEPESVPLPILHQPLTAFTSSRLSRADELLQQASQGRFNGRSLLFLSLLGLAAHQIARGRFLSPASTLLWNALSLLKEEKRNSSDSGNTGEFES
jgi:hypothetical protein